MAKPKESITNTVANSAAKNSAKPKPDTTDWSVEIAKIESVYAKKPNNQPQTKTTHEKTTTTTSQAAVLLQKQAAEKKAAEEAFAKKFQALLDLDPILKSVAVQGDGNINTDAHTYTRSIINPHLPIVSKIDTDYIKADGTLAPATVLNEALRCANPEWAADIRTTFSYIPADKNAIEVETGANIHQFLSKTWSLAKKLDQQKQIAETLHLNIADAGKCMAGLIARLYSPYVKIIHHLLKQSIEQEQAPVPKRYKKS